MKLNKVFVIVVLMLTFTLSIFTNVYAEEDMRGTVELSLENSSSYKVGEEIIVNVSINVTGFEGILFFYADVNYDNTVLKYEGVTPASKWNVVNQDENVYLEKSDTENVTGKICSLKFKVLKDVTDTTIKLESIDASGTNGSVHYLYENVNSPSLVIKEKQSEQPVNPVDPTDTTQPVEGDKQAGSAEGTQNNKQAQEVQQTKPDNNKTNKIQSKENGIFKNKLPKTGYSIFEDIVMAVMLVVLVIVIIKYIRRLKYTKE